MEQFNSFIALIKPFFELVYLISSVGIAVFAYLGLQQIQILKATASTQAKRDALKLTSEQCSYYVDVVIPLQNGFYKAIEENNIKYFEGWTTTITNNQITTSHKDPKLKRDFKAAIPTLVFLNSMEAFSTFFTSRVADELVAYNSVGETFIGTCERIMPWLLHCRNAGYFKSTTSLYLIWKQRSEIEKLMREKQNIDDKLANSTVSTSNPIGTEFRY